MTARNFYDRMMCAAFHLFSTQHGARNTKMRYLAIDYGTKRTGLAICDAAETISSPLTVLHGQKALLNQIAEIVKTENVDAIVLGLPLNMSGTESDQTKLALNFAERLKERLSVPVHLQDERLSSFGAEEKLAPADFTRGKRKKRIDAVAAAEILGAFLEQKAASNDS
ncbi:MAG: Holliday junction resolvase RuvX [Sedimentisphaerales bacterium]|nr:Holliday junction resolvase RuvX [Sedimentisphaerales bacterium]